MEKIPLGQVVQETLANNKMSHAFGETLAATQALAEPNPAMLEYYMRTYLRLFDEDEINTLWFVAAWMQDRPYEALQVHRSAGFEAEKGAVHAGLNAYIKILRTLSYDRHYLLDSPDRISEIAQNLHIELLFEAEEAALENLVAEIDAIENVDARYQRLAELKARVETIVTQFNIKSFPKYEKGVIERPEWDDLVNAEKLEYPDSTVKSYRPVEAAIETAVYTANRHALDQALAKIEHMPPEAVNKLRQTFGAKAAQLIALKDVQDQIKQKNLKPLEDLIDIPDFKAVPVEVFEAWAAGQDIDVYLGPVYEWAKQLKQRYWDEKAGCIVRSSAVFSEDGENLTGAGIYDSVVVEPGSKYQDFKAAVLKVYQSVNSDRAKAYRVENGVADEKMGLVVQTFLQPEERRGLGYVNTVTANQPELMEVVFAGKVGWAKQDVVNRNFVRRSELDKVLGTDRLAINSRFNRLHHFPPDVHRVHTDDIVREVLISGVVEKLLGKPVQIELVHSHAAILSIVQVRPLPEKFLNPADKISFPDRPHLHEGAAVGAGDLELNVLHNDDDNYDQRGVVFFFRNREWSITPRDYALPKEGAVVVIDQDGQNGHIQTLCAERGLICIFNDGRTFYGSDAPSIASSHEGMSYGKLRVVADGIDGRIYEVDN